MNKQIDWSKAPEGTTHYYPSQGASTVPLWIKFNDRIRAVGYLGSEEFALFYSDVDFQPCIDMALAIPCPATWNGPEDGLPPVGLDVQTSHGTVKVLAHGICKGRPVAVAQGNDTLITASADVFRPIRTAEQLAAEAHRAKYMPELIKLWYADTQRTEFLEAVYTMIAEAGK